MAKWNDTDEPIAYLITFRTYGTWLQGDERGSINKYHNKYGTPRSVPSNLREQLHFDRLKSPPFILNVIRRGECASTANGILITVRGSIKEVEEICGLRSTFTVLIITLLSGKAGRCQILIKQTGRPLTQAVLTYWPLARLAKKEK